MWLITFRGEESGDFNNIFAFDDSGNAASPPTILPTGGVNPTLQELRGFQAVAPLLYVVDAHVSLSQVLIYTLKDGAYVYTSTFTSHGQTAAVLHPFDLAPDGSGGWYISNQDSNVVAAFDSTGNPLPLPSSLSSLTNASNFLPGTFVASSVGALPGVPTPAPPDVAQPLGLDVSPRDGSKVSNSVRGLACHGGVLYVADEPGDAVKAYDLATGGLVGQIVGANLSAPVHLLCSDGVAFPATLFIGSTGNDSVVTFDLSGGPPSGAVAPTTLIDGEVKHVSGMDFGADGWLYTAERKAMKIKRFALTYANSTLTAAKQSDFPIVLSDEPEFIRYAPGGD
jgi:hypothetical protein